MSINVGVVMDPIKDIIFKKDTTLAMLLAAQNRDASLFYMEQKDLLFHNGELTGFMRSLEVRDDKNNWFKFGKEGYKKLSDLDVIFMRKDPPFNIEYIYTTYFLEHAAKEGVLVVNDPRSLRDANEKIITTWFPECSPPTMVTRNIEQLLLFLDEQGEIVVKPLDYMGGVEVFQLKKGDPNVMVTLETITRLETRTIIAQKYIKEITTGGDKRILLIDGEAVPFALARVPREGDSRGNLAAGAIASAVPLTDRDRWICEQVGPVMSEMGLLFAGVDVIGDYLTEINVTSPTCLRELDAACGLDIGGQIMDAVEKRLQDPPSSL